MRPQGQVEGTHSFRELLEGQSMNQALTDPQMGFAFLSEAEQPAMAPIEKVAEFESEVDAINYSIETYAKKHGYTFTQTNLAGQLGMTKQTLSKLRQGVIGIPRNRLQRIVETTRSLAIVQFHSFRLGLTLRTKDQEQERVRHEKSQVAQIQHLSAEVESLNAQLANYKRAVGE